VPNWIRSVLGMATLPILETIIFISERYEFSLSKSNRFTARRGRGGFMPPCGFHIGTVRSPIFEVKSILGSSR
jgi:hypothetical protein